MTFFSVHKEEIKVSMNEDVSLHLYTVDPVEVYFQKDHSSKPVLLCGDNLCEQNWKYNSNTQTIELVAVMEGNLGTYTVKDKTKKYVFCEYILISLADSKSDYQLNTGIGIGFCLVTFACSICVYCLTV